MSKPTQIAGNSFEGGTVQVNSGASVELRDNWIGSLPDDLVSFAEWQMLKGLPLDDA